MKITHIVIIFVLLTGAITVGDVSKKPVSPATTKTADCCTVCPPLCPYPPGELSFKFRDKVQY